MAKKRKVGAQEGKEEEASLKDDSDLPQWMREQSWGQWFITVYASRLYALVCFAFLAFLGLELYSVLGSENSWMVLPVLAFFVALQVTIYLFLWGSKGRLRS